MFLPQTFADKIDLFLSLNENPNFFLSIVDEKSPLLSFHIFLLRVVDSHKYIKYLNMKPNIRSTFSFIASCTNSAPGDFQIPKTLSIQI